MNHSATPLMWAAIDSAQDCKTLICSPQLTTWKHMNSASSAAIFNQFSSHHGLFQHHSSTRPSSWHSAFDPPTSPGSPSITSRQTNPRKHTRSGSRRPKKPRRSRRSTKNNHAPRRPRRRRRRPPPSHHPDRHRHLRKLTPLSRRSRVKIVEYDPKHAQQHAQRCL